MAVQDRILYEEVIRNLDILDEDTFIQLSEDDKTDMMGVIISNLAGFIKDKVKNLNLTVIDASRGNFMKIRGIDSILSQLDSLNALVRNSNNPNISRYKVKEELSYIEMAINSLETFTNIFEGAYKEQKTLLMLFYKIIAAAIIMEINYLFSAMVGIDSDDSIYLKDDFKTSRVSFINAIERFVEFIKNGTMKLIINSVGILRESYYEIPQTVIFNESSMLNNVIASGVKAISNKFSINKSGLAYKTAGIAILLVAIRDVLYTLAQSKTSVNDALLNAKNKPSSPSIASKIFGAFTMDADVSSQSANNDIDYEDKKLLAGSVRQAVPFDDFNF